MAKNTEPLSPEDKAAAKEADLVIYWGKEIDRAKRREKAWRKEARELITIYEGDDEIQTPYNILYSNTETLGPALYSATPRPDTRPRTAQESATAMAAAGLCDAFLESFIDNGDQGYCSFDQATKVAVQSALVPGRGVQRFHYTADVERDEKGAPRKVKYERIDAEELAWDKILHGHAKTWTSVPWIAFEHVWTEDEAIAELGETVARTLTFQTPEPDDSRSEERSSADDHARVATVYEIWSKKKREILWLEAEATEDFLKPAEPDPYALSGFYPIQEPLQFMRRISSMLPVPLYRLYKSQAKELNKLTRRIDKVIEQIKIRGFYDEGIEDLKTVLEADDGILHPVRNLASLGPGAKVENAIWLVPVEKHVAVLQSLMQDRQAVKQVIFEIMGIADIMRGASVASETLGAQKIKNQWGTLRLKDAQGQVARFIRDGLRIAAELGFSKLAPATLRKLTGSQLPSAAQLKELEVAAQAAQAKGTALPPDAMSTMALPSFEECIAALKDDFSRAYLVDIETNSSIDADAAEDKEQITEFLGAFSQLLNGLGPMMEKGVLSFDTGKAIMLSISKRFNLGKQLYRELAKMQAPKPAGGPDPKQMKALQDAQTQVADGQKALEQGKIQASLEKVKFDAEKRVFEIQKQAAEQIAQAREQAKQIQSTASGAVKAAQDKAAKTKDTADMQKLMSEMGTLLQNIQSAAQQAQKDLQSEKDTMAAEMTADRVTKEAEFQSKLKDDLASVVDQIKQAVTAAASVKRVARKGKDGSWTSETVQ